MADSSKDIQLRELKDMINDLKKMIKTLQATVDAGNKREEALTRERDNLKEEIDLLRKKLFGTSSEKRTLDIPGQLNFFNEAELEQDPEAAKAEVLESILPEKTAKKRKGRATDAERFKGVPVEKKYLELSEKEKLCPVCGTPLKEIGEEFVRRELVFVPAKLKVYEYYSKNYECPQCRLQDIPVIKKGKGVQIIYGPQVSVIKSDLEEYMEKYGDESDEGDSHELIKSPMTGTVIPLSEVPDEAFAGKMMGDGAAVIPDDEYVYAPADGTVTFVFPTKHAVGFRTDGGHEMLIHVGIDTVSLSGDGFEAFVHDGDHVRTGDKLLKADIQKIKDKVPSLASPVLFTDLPDCLEVHILKRGKIRSGEPFLELHNKEK